LKILFIYLRLAVLIATFASHFSLANTIEVITLENGSDEEEFRLLTDEEYSMLSAKNRILYTNQLRKAWLDFENEYPQAQEVAEVSKWRKFFLGLQPIDSAFATSEIAPPCIICGVQLLSVKNAQGRYVCPTRGRPCSGQSDGFQCGPLFDNACISRTPINTLSYRGYIANSGVALSTEEYTKAKIDIESTYRQICFTKQSPGCSILAQKIRELNLGQIAAIKGEPDTVTSSGTDTVLNRSASAATSGTDGVTYRSASASLSGTGAATYRSQSTSAASSRPASTQISRSASAPSATRSVNPAAQTQRTVTQRPGCSLPTDRRTGAILPVPIFNLKVDQSCHYTNNRRLLGELATKGCSAGLNTASLFSTTLSTKNRVTRPDGTKGYNFIMDEISKITGVIEDIQRSSSGSDPVYRIQMILPTTKRDDGTLDRVFLDVIERGGKLYLRRRDGTLSDEITIGNQMRNAISLTDVSGTRAGLNRLFKTTLTSDCRLAEQVRPFFNPSRPGLPTAVGAL
jgi:hypothetical protein